MRPDIARVIYRESAANSRDPIIWRPGQSRLICQIDLNETDANIVQGNHQSVHQQAAQYRFVAVRRCAELQPVFASAFHVIRASGASSTELVMTAVVAVSAAAHGVCARHEIAHWNFRRLCFVHITFLQ